VLFSSLIGSNMQYFSAIPYGIALLLLPAAMGRAPRTSTAYRWPSAVIAVLLAASLMPIFAKLPMDGFSTIIALYQKSENGRVRISEDIKASLHKTHTPFAMLHERIAATPWAQLIRTVESENARSGGALAVQIQPDAEDVWRRLKDGTPWWCMAPHLMVPAETGVFELRSVPPRRIEEICAPPGIVWYGFGGDQDAHRAMDLTDPQICALVAPAGIREIYRLHSFQSLSRNSITRCKGQ